MFDIALETPHRLPKPIGFVNVLRTYVDATLGTQYDPTDGSITSGNVMEQKAMHILDIELTAFDIHALKGAGAIAAFFAHLGYNTDACTLQTPANLDIAADNVIRRSKRMELIGDQEGLFQIYLFELVSITVAHIRASTRVFRKRTKNYLLVLASDYLCGHPFPEPANAGGSGARASAGI
jgi:hypothetical protein